VVASRPGPGHDGAVTSPSSDLPCVFGKYLLLRRIGRGGMAEIFRALQLGRQGVTRQVAIKRMLAHISQDPHFVNMFINEAKLASLLDHANVVRIYEFGNVDDRLYHCLEYVHGVTVMDIIRACLARKQPMPVELACLIFTEALYGLDQAHRQAGHTGAPLALIHRDLTPSNLLVSFEGEVKVADFGIAKAAASSVHTQSGYIKGKFRYMSPEQARGDELDQRSDVFSLATCFAELLTLRPMFHADGDLATLLKVRAAEFTRPRELNQAIPPALETSLLRALSREREQRYPSAADWLEELEHVVFECGLKRFRSDLKSAMQDWFGELIHTREAELADEARQAAAMRASLPERTLEDEDAADAGEMRTLLLEAPDLDAPVQQPQAPAASGDGPTRDLRPPRARTERAPPSEGPSTRPRPIDPSEVLVDDQRPTLRDLPVVPEAAPEADADGGDRPTMHDLPQVAAPVPTQAGDLGKQRTLQVPVVSPPDEEPGQDS
jgi:eukaryotic-like serine/threonine-protein kinase